MQRGVLAFLHRCKPHFSPLCMLQLWAPSPSSAWEAPQEWESLWGFVKHEFSPAEDTRVCQGCWSVAHPHPGESLLQFSSHPFTPSWPSQRLVNLRCGTLLCWRHLLHPNRAWEHVLAIEWLGVTSCSVNGSCCKMGCWTPVPFSSLVNRSLQQLPLSSLLSSPCQLCDLPRDGSTQMSVPVLCFAGLGNK